MGRGVDPPDFAVEDAVRTFTLLLAGGSALLAAALAAVSWRSVLSGRGAGLQQSPDVDRILSFLPPIVFTVIALRLGMPLIDALQGSADESKVVRQVTDTVTIHGPVAVCVMFALSEFLSTSGFVSNLRAAALSFRNSGAHLADWGKSMVSVSNSLKTLNADTKRIEDGLDGVAQALKQDPEKVTSVASLELAAQLRNLSTQLNGVSEGLRAVKTLSEEGLVSRMRRAIRS